MGEVLSVIVPCYNEEQVIRQTHARLSAALSALCTREGLRPEILYVDDGSRDGTAAALADIQTGAGREGVAVRVIGLSRNFGHQLAVTAGLDHCAGDAVVIIDADLQDPPELIAEMVALWRQGWKVVYAQRRQRAGETRFKLWTSNLFYRFLNRLSDIGILRDTGDFRLIDREVVLALRRMPERARFLRGMVSWVGFRQIALPYDRASRAAGESKYPLVKMLRFAVDGILALWTGSSPSRPGRCGLPSGWV